MVTPVRMISFQKTNMELASHMLLGEKMGIAVTTEIYFSGHSTAQEFSVQT